MSKIRCLLTGHVYSQAETKLTVYESTKDYLKCKVSLICDRCGKTRVEDIAIAMPDWMRRDEVTE